MAPLVQSAHDLLDLEISTLRQYVELFPAEGLSKIITGWLSSGISKYPLTDEGICKEGPDLSEGGVSLAQELPVSQEDCLELMNEGIANCPKSPLAHCLLADFYLSLEEYESAVESARKGLKYAAAEAKKTDLSFQRNRDALNSTLATALVYYQAPRNHLEAKQIFQSILERKPQFTTALIGIGLVLEEEEEYYQAFQFLEQALQHDPSNGRIGAESAWCQALAGHYETGLQRLQSYLEYPQLNTTEQRGRELRAQTLYRIGVCIWELNPTKAARRDRNGAYEKLLAAIKVNPNYAPAYTLLGIYYEDYKQDRKRARQCFQKAFELSPSEVVAAERLARLFAGQGEWDIVEVVSQRVIDSGKARQVPGSKRKGVSWPFSALGVVQMNKQEYQKSITSFLSALRISPNDYHSYVGLGESYHNSGRYNSASRAFNYAENPTDGVVFKKTEEESWFTRYMLANVNRELREFDEALAGYEVVLSTRSKEFGVSIALLQTLVEKGWHCIETGFFGEAADSAVRAIEIAELITEYKPDAFNLWKTVGDACSLFTWVQEKLVLFPARRVEEILRCKSKSDVDFDAHKDIDGVGVDALHSISVEGEDKDTLTKVIKASILAQKRAISSCTNDVHAQAVAWYNLGWTEYRAHVCLEQETQDGPQLTSFLRAAMLCFKRAIELEAGNAEFWNSLGVVTMTLSPKVAQHAFVRSLHLNERSVHTWTNLGALYILQNDTDLAHTAFSRAQSQDPDYSLAWVGEGIIALLIGEANEALSHFTHAFELSESSLLLPKRQYAVSAFDSLLSSPLPPSEITALIQPLFALQQLYLQAPYDIPHRHLAALFLERVGNHDAAITALHSVTTIAEQDYEATESLRSLTHVAQAKIDLARNLLATSAVAPAAEEAETALDLLSELESNTQDTVLSSQQLEKAKLSARLTAGLAHYFLGALDAALPYFRTSLEATASDPDIICLLAQVLWAKGGATEKQVARDQLFTAAGIHEHHVQLLTLIGAMVVLDDDDDAETMSAVRADLERVRADTALGPEQRARVDQVLTALCSVQEGAPEAAAHAAQRAVVLAPWSASAWCDVADTETSYEGHGCQFARSMALLTAGRRAPPGGSLRAEALAGAVAGTSCVADVQRAVVLAPWAVAGWTALAECVEGDTGSKSTLC